MTPTPGPEKNGAHRPVFTCTFCHHLSDGPPRVLGRRARLACAACCAALVDLAVCWACGEVVYRGCDCVSLGWCFWHRGCYGCLLCGNRRVAVGVTVAGLFDGEHEGEKQEREESGEQTGYENDGASRAREVDEVPLCAHCAVEVEGQQLGEEGIVQKALDRGEKMAGGGLSRLRWDRMAGAAAAAAPVADGRKPAGNIPVCFL